MSTTTTTVLWKFFTSDRETERAQSKIVLFRLHAPNERTKRGRQEDSLNRKCVYGGKTANTCCLGLFGFVCCFFLIIYVLECAVENRIWGFESGFNTTCRLFSDICVGSILKVLGLSL